MKGKGGKRGDRGRAKGERKVKKRKRMKRKLLRRSENEGLGEDVRSTWRGPNVPSIV